MKWNGISCFGGERGMGRRGDGRTGVSGMEWCGVEGKGREGSKGRNKQKKYVP